MKAVPDNSHCFKHANTHRMDQPCYHCENERLIKQMVREHVRTQWPHANRVTHPQLMKELDEILKEHT